MDKKWKVIGEQMTTAGVQWLLNHPLANPEFNHRAGVYGSISPANDDARDLRQAIVDVYDGASGAMVQAIIGAVMLRWRQIR